MPNDAQKGRPTQPIASEKKEIEGLIREVDPGLLEQLNKDKRNRLVKAIPSVTSLIVARHSMFSGPIPPADMLAEYDKIIENGAERIMRMAEVQSTHRQALELRVVENQVKQSEKGQWMAFVLTILLSAIGTFAIWMDEEWVAGIVFGTTIGGLVAVFVLGKRAQRADLNDKDERSR